MNNRRRLVIALGAGAFATPFAAFAQRSPAGVPRIGLLWLGSSGPSPLVAAFREGLRSHGYSEGRNFVLEDHSNVGRYEQLAEIAIELVRQKVDIIVTYGVTATQAARKATATIPIVMVAGSDPVAMGLANSLSRPGGNVTGLSMVTAELNAKRLELLKETIPGLRRVGVLMNPDSQGEVEQFKLLETAAQTLKLQLYAAEVRIVKDLESAFAAMGQRRPAAFVSVGSSMLLANRGRIVELAAKQKLPGVFPQSEFVDAGGLFSYGASLTDGLRRAATYVDKILKGAKPANLPIEQPTKFELLVNLKTAKALGVKIPDSIMLRADKVIE